MHLMGNTVHSFTRSLRVYANRTCAPRSHTYTDTGRQQAIAVSLVNRMSKTEMNA